jgi:hypothetical protein
VGLLQDAFDAQLEELPRHACRQLVREKLAELDHADETLVEQIVTCVLDGAELDVPDGSPLAALAFTAHDHRRAETIADEMIARLPDLVRDLSVQLGGELVDGLRDQWTDCDAGIAAEVDGFRQRLRARWNAPMRDLRVLLEFSRDLGSHFHAAHQASRLKRHRQRNEVLVRLHVRACQVTAEIILLLENGFSDGAHARWRTLLELMVTAVLIETGGDPLAERFMAYEAVERKKTMEEHNRCASLTGATRIIGREAREIDKAYASALRRYGPDMKNTNGWAAGQLGLPSRPKFSDLQLLAGTAESRLDYKLASFGVHATPQASISLSLLDSELRLAGASNAGLEHAGVNTASSLCRLTSLLLGDPWDLDKLATGYALLRLRDDIAAGFFKAARRLVREEVRVRAAIEREALQRHKGSGRRSVKDALY